MRSGKIKNSILLLTMLGLLVVAFACGLLLGSAGKVNEVSGYANNFWYRTENGTTGYSVFCYMNEVWDWSGCVKEDGVVQLVEEYEYVRNDG